MESVGEERKQATPPLLLLPLSFDKSTEQKKPSKMEKGEEGKGLVKLDFAPAESEEGETGGEREKHCSESRGRAPRLRQS